MNKHYVPTAVEMAESIERQCGCVKDMLLAKNSAYGNSAADPLRVFSKSDTLEQINVRMDDKLSRLARGTAGGEDAELDLIGYLILKRAILAVRGMAGGSKNESC